MVIQIMCIDFNFPSVLAFPKTTAEEDGIILLPISTRRNAGRSFRTGVNFAATARNMNYVSATMIHYFVTQVRFFFSFYNLISYNCFLRSTS